MLISPPFLLARNNNETEDAWLDRCMTGYGVGDGAYPIGNRLMWHGGQHLTAKRINANTTEPVRAIADGTVLFKRKSTATSDERLKHGTEIIADNGVVVLKHTTDIGTGTNATAVTFYSVYMHMDTVAETPAVGKPVYRKDKLGIAGRLDSGTDRKIHFEIVCDTANLNKLVGRSTGPLVTTAHGRTDAVYGEIYFTLPAHTAVYGGAQPPALHSATPFAAPVGVTSEKLIVGMFHACGNGYTLPATGNHAAQAGSTYFTTRKENGTVLGYAVQDADGEYNLYTTATNISKAYTTAHQPAPASSAVYELLRFGRVVNTANETLTPANVPHWRKVRYGAASAETGWVNLNGTGIRIFSDADCPQWQGWQLINDDPTPNDSRCDSRTLLDELDTNHDHRNQWQAALSALGDLLVGDPTSEEHAARQRTLRRAICNIPSEWNVNGLADRMSWVKTPSDGNPNPMSATDFNNQFVPFLTALSFECPELFKATWHFNPREFVRHFRMCGWLSETELAQCIPRNSLAGTVDWRTAQSRAQTHAKYINTFFVKYLNSSRQRHAHALAQIYQETGLLNYMDELGAGHSKVYTAFYGRGYFQLTWSGNYKAYGKFKNIPNQPGTAVYFDNRITSTSTHLLADGGISEVWAPKYNPSIVSSNLFLAGDSSGFFWVSKTFRGKKNMNKSSDVSLSPTLVGFNNWLVNGGGDGYDKRQQFARLLAIILLDEPLKSGAENFVYPPLGPRVNIGTADQRNMCPLLCATFPPTEVPYNQTVRINYEPQRP